jgi:hypothetical protein
MVEFFPELISSTPWVPTFAELSDSEQRAVITRMDDAVSQRADGNGTTVTIAPCRRAREDSHSKHR